MVHQNFAKEKVEYGERPFVNLLCELSEKIIKSTHLILYKMLKVHMQDCVK